MNDQQVADSIIGGDAAAMYASFEELPQRRSILLQSCCGPCSTAVMERLAPDFDITLFFYNPNVTDEDEYSRRLDAQRTAVERFNASLEMVNPIRLAIGEYNPQAFRDAVKGLEKEPEGGARCTECFKLRLVRSAEYALVNGLERFTTTLSVSPHKDFNTISEIGFQTAFRFGLTFLSEDFKKRDGYRRSAEMSGLYGLYRQNYCGCEFSRMASRA
jgi:predicted adenine nucleotide alpha hydrolase (AANH) superfamily ATPase